MDYNIARIQLLKTIYNDHLNGKSKFSINLSDVKGMGYLNLIYLIDKEYLHSFGQSNTEILYRIAAKGIDKIESGEVTL